MSLICLGSRPGSCCLAVQRLARRRTWLLKVTGVGAGLGGSERRMGGTRPARLLCGGGRMRSRGRRSRRCWRPGGFGLPGWDGGVGIRPRPRLPARTGGADDGGEPMARRRARRRIDCGEMVRGAGASWSCGCRVNARAGRGLDRCRRAGRVAGDGPGVGC
jgi:hypothetical protein